MKKLASTVIGRPTIKIGEQLFRDRGIRPGQA